VAAASTICSGVKLGVEVDTDRAGLDLRDFEPTSYVAESCQASCANDPSCKAWTFVPSGYLGPLSGARCFLKSGVPAPSSLQSAISGIKDTEIF
jgi:hypothetical protein